MASIEINTPVLHATRGHGTVIALIPGTDNAVVQFTQGGTEVASFSELQLLYSPAQAVETGQWSPPLNVITRFQAEAIRSVNDSWGVFIRSKIALLPHQLWVCRKVTQSLPARWLVADDVGLGKTIEAGLVLLPLISRKLIHRILILCPAKLVPQWHRRMLDMFDIRLETYTPEFDKPNSGFWKGSSRSIVASFQTLRLDHNGRHARLLEATPWDMLIVDEAHHLNADEKRGPTLGYTLIRNMLEAKRIASMVFFTGTPHRGKDYGFLSLLELLRDDLFSVSGPMASQLSCLNQAMIRNNKQCVTDLRGNRLFKEPVHNTETYAYSAGEEAFYNMLTEFIIGGKAYASTLDKSTGKAVMLVLCSMQKLASSSVAAIAKALKKRLERTSQKKHKIRETKKLLDELAQSESEVDLDRVSEIEEELAAETVNLLLIENEEEHLRQLIAATERISKETKIEKILSLLQGPFNGRSVLFFTEYKATQALLMSSLIARYGEKSVAFINGDSCVEDVVLENGETRSVFMKREDAVQKFNTGQARFLIATEAGGEGIDLQQNCHSMIHVDLPWNPMRMHQRLGRLNRYGQQHAVEVYIVRNPDTVEARIWDILNEKIHRIMLAMKEVMEEPEDLMQLVLGMTSPAFFQEMFVEAAVGSEQSFSNWFNKHDAQFGGKDVIDAVREIVGNCARFDFQQVSASIPKVDLDELEPFFSAMLELNHRNVKKTDGKLAFLTPEAWKEFGVKKNYQDIVFDRHAIDSGTSLGIGHLLFDKALEQASLQTEVVASVPSKILKNGIAIFRVRDQLTTSGNRGSIIIGVENDPAAGLKVLADWSLLQTLNELVQQPGQWRRQAREQTHEIDRGEIKRFLDDAYCHVVMILPDMNLEYQQIVVEVQGILWPDATPG